MPRNVQHFDVRSSSAPSPAHRSSVRARRRTRRLAVGATTRYEAIDLPSGNTDFFGPTQRWQTLNAFGAVGSRRVNAAFAELNMPVFDNLDVNLSGRFDAYSGGQEAFSPKIGARWEALDILTLRATYSEGFRIPAFAEASALPSTGFVTNTAILFNDVFLANYGCSVATFVTCPAYIRGSYGLTTIANPDLQPEDSSSITLGAIVEPFKGLDTVWPRTSISRLTTTTLKRQTRSHLRRLVPSFRTIIRASPHPSAIYHHSGCGRPELPVRSAEDCDCRIQT